MQDAFIALIPPFTFGDGTLLFGAVVLAGFLRGFVGFGAALVLVPICSLVFGPLLAVPVAAVSGLPSVVQVLPGALRQTDWRLVGPMTAATFAAAPFGTLVLISVDPAATRMGISVLVLAMVVFLYRGWQIAQRPGFALSAMVGALAGLIQGTAGIGGPPAVALVLSRGGIMPMQRANVISVVTALSFCGLLPLWFHGFLTLQVVAVSAAIVPLYALSTWAGKRYFARSGQRNYRHAALLILTAIGLATLLLAVQDYFRLY